MWVKDQGVLFVVPVFSWGIRPPPGGLCGRLFEAGVGVLVGKEWGMGFGC